MRNAYSSCDEVGMASSAQINWGDGVIENYDGSATSFSHVYGTNWPVGFDIVYMNGNSKGS